MTNKEKNSKTKYIVLAAVSGILCLGCIIWLVIYLTGLNRAEREMEKLRSSYVSDAPIQPDKRKPSSAGTPMGSDIPATDHKREIAQLDLEACGLANRRIDFDGLKEKENGDIYAWILVPGTAIDYPVLQHPDEMDYYLDHNLDGSTGYPGCIYTQRMNAKDWSNFNTVLYGHNMKNGTYFAGLHNFKDTDFFQQNRYIYIYTEDDRILAYEIFAAYTAGNEHLLMTYDINTDTGRQGYLQSIYEHTGSECNFRKDELLSETDHIITLSTCISGQDTKRYLVQGVLVAEGQQP